MSDSVGSVSVDVVPDARGWAERLRAQIRDYTAQVNVEADTTKARAQLDELVRTRVATIQANADTAKAEAQLDETARDRRSNVQVDVDRSAISEGSKALDGFVGKLGLLPALAIAAGAALIPLTGVLGGLAAGLVAPLAIAGGGATLFAVLAGFAAKDTTEKLKNIDKLRQKLNGLSKGTAEYAQTQKQLRDAQAALTPEQKKFAAAQDTLAGAFQKLLEGKGGAALLGVLAQGMTVLAHALPTVTPLIVAVGGALSTLLSDVDRAVQSQAFSRFVGQVSRLAARDLVSGGHILGSLATGVGSLIVQLDKHLGGDVLHGLERLSSSFADWASSKGARQDVRGFVDYFHENGPQVAHTIGAVARGLGHIVEALAPLGPPVLKIIEGVSNAISAIPVPVLTALAGAFAGLVTVQKLGGFKALGALSGGLGGARSGGVKGAIGGLLTGGVQKVFVVNMPPGGLGGGFAGSAESGRGVGSALGVAAGVGGVASRFGRLGAGLRRLGFGPEMIPIGLGSAPGQNSLFSRIFQGAPATNMKVLPASAFPGTFAASAKLKSTTDAFDALRAHAARASQQIDLIGPRTQQTSGSAGKAIDSLRAKLDAIHDKKFAIIAQDQAAIRSLERIQAMRLADKSFTVYQRNQIIERTVGPGGGMGQNPHGSAGGGSGRTPVHIHLDDNGRTTLTGHMDDRAQRTYDANRDFERQHR